MVYVDNDPIVQVHASALLTGQGNTRMVLADARDPQAILDNPDVRELIDFSEPAALLFLCVMHFITELDGPGQIIATLRDALVPGSYLALSHATLDFHDQAIVDATTKHYEKAASPLVPRSHTQIMALFDGWELIEPGLVQLPLWRPEGGPWDPRALKKIGIYGGVGQFVSQWSPV